MTRCLLVLLVASLLAAAACGGITSGGGAGDRDATAPNASGSGSSGSSAANSGREGSGTSGSSSGLVSTSGASVGLPPPDSGPSGCPAGAPLSCYVNTQCANGAHTTLTGKVYDPAGKVPLYNVIVFVPNDPNNLPPIAPGTSTCDTCFHRRLRLRDDHRQDRGVHAAGRPDRQERPAGRADRQVAPDHHGPERRRLRDDDASYHGARPGAAAEEPHRRRHAADGAPHGRSRRSRLLLEPGGHRRGRVLRPSRRGTARHLPGSRNRIGRRPRGRRERAGAVERNGRRLHDHELPALGEQAEPRELRPRPSGVRRRHVRSRRDSRRGHELRQQQSQHHEGRQAGHARLAR